MKELILKILNSDLSNEAKAEEIQRQIDIHDSEKIKNTPSSDRIENY